LTVDELAFVVLEEPEGGFSATAVGAAIFTEADNLDALRVQVLDAVRCHFDDATGPRTVRLDYSWPDALGTCVTLHVPSPLGWVRRRKSFP
jgi:hypothetical protein